MTLASDQNLDPSGLSSTSQRMLELREAVFSEWERRVRASVAKAAPLAHPILINTLPALYGNLAESLTPDYPRASAGASVPTVASEHGGERARLTDYDIDSLISEYHLLRTTIFDVLAAHHVPLSRDEMMIISAAIDTTVKQAVSAFALAQAAFREQFISALAHDLRTPLSTACMATHLISRTQEPERIAYLAERISANLGRIDRMIQDLLDTVVFHNGGRLRLAPSCFDMLELVQEVADQAAVLQGPRFEVSGVSVTGWWGREPMKRALENVVGNAVKYGRPGSPIRLDVGEVDGRVVMTVHNQGDPIPIRDQETIFQVFRRAMAGEASKERGWGIGLPFARSVAESHAGSVGVDSSAERGTTFTIDIPKDVRPYENAPTLGGV